MSDNNESLNDTIDLDKLVNSTESDFTPGSLGKVDALLAAQQRMGDELISRFSRNIKAFESFLPDIASTFRAYKPKETIEFFCAENGVANLQFVERNEILYKCLDPRAICHKQMEEGLKTIPFKTVRYDNEYDWAGHIHHRYLNECINIANEYVKDKTRLTPMDIGSMPNCVMIGVGLGYHLETLYEKVEVANLILVEPNLDLFFASLHTFDWDQLLVFLKKNNYGIKFLLGVNAQQLFNDMYNFYDRHGRFLSGFWWNFVHYASKDVREIAQVLKKDYYRTFSAMGFYDDHLIGTSHAIYAIQHKKRLIRNDVLLPKAMAEAPVFVVGSGPSLDHDIPFLRKNQDKAYILACGTAFDTLYHAGIQPDFYCCTERIPQIAQSIRLLQDKSYVDNSILLTGDVVHPYTVDLFKHSAIFGKPDEPFYWMALGRMKFAKQWQFVVEMNPLVGNMGVSGACFFGFRNLYLFGLDNGKKLGTEKMHSKYTAIYNGAGVNDTGGNYTIENILPGNFGGECESGYFFKLSVRNIEDILEIFKDKVKCYNCSDGSFIEGATPLHSEDLDFKDRPILDKQALRDFVDNHKTMSVDLPQEGIEKLLDYDDFSRTLKYIASIFDERPVRRIDYIQKLEFLSEYITDIGLTAEGKFKSFMLNGTIQGISMMALRALYHCKNEAECIRDANAMIDKLKYFLEDADVLYRLLPNFILGPHQKLMNCKTGQDHPGSPAPEMPEIFTLVDNNNYKDSQEKFIKKYE